MSYVSRKINLVFLFSLIATLVWELYFKLLSPQLSKGLVGIGMWLAFACIPLTCYKKNLFGKWSLMSMKLLLTMAIVSLGISIFFPDNLTPNKWTTLFGNPFCFLMMITPLFVFLANTNNIIKYIKIYIIVFLVVGIPFAVNRPMGYSIFMWFIPLLLPFANKKQLGLFALSIGCCIYTAFYANETSRTNILILLFAAINYYLVFVVKNKKLIKWFCIGIIILPAIYSIITLIEPEYSIFSIIINKLSSQTANSQLTTDTRSFLFFEINEDLTETHSWLLGKGADGHYYSLYFDRSAMEEGVDSFNRLTSEVTFLQLLLRGGVLYTFGYYMLLLCAVYKAFTCSNNSFMLSVAVMISCWICVSFVSLLFGCSMLHVIFFTLVGCCLSPYWLNKTDEEIKRILS